MPGRREPTPSGLRRLHRFIVLSFLMLLALPLAMPIAPAGASHGFGQDAGWDKAQAQPRTSVRVWAQPSLGIDLGAVIRPWNRLAGWNLFRVVGVAKRADVLFRPSNSTWVRCGPSYTEAYQRCVIWSATSSKKILRHELGHALGFADHVQAAVYARGGHVNPKVCDDPADSSYSRYSGVMSYCSWNSVHQAWFGRGDERMLTRAGYGNSKWSKGLPAVEARRRMRAPSFTVRPPC